jgi:hypothetical protein
MRWVLIRPLCRSLFYDPETQEPLGLEYLSSVLKKAGHQVLILDNTLNNLEDIKLARRAASFQPDAIGFSITTGRELGSVERITSELKRALNGRQVLWIAGGNYPTTEPESAARDLPGDCHILKYDGEISILQISRLWEEGLIHTLPRLIVGEPQLELDELPFPERPYYHYLKNFGWAFNLQGSRGCCSACKYCASSGMRGNLTSWRGRSPESMAAEIAFLYAAYSARSFNFVDEDFLGPPVRALERAMRFSEEITRRRLTITFGIQVRPNSLSEEVIDYLAKAGLKYVFMGIESDNPCDFKIWGRAFCDKTWTWVGYLQEKGIEVNAGTLLFHPDCTFEGIRHFATNLRQYRLLNYRTASNRLDGMPGSFFHKKYIAEHPEETSPGIIRLPFADQSVEPFYKTVLTVLAPIEIPSMHALCIMPIVQTRRIFGDSEEEYRSLKKINADCDDKVAACFFSLLEMYENKSYSEQRAGELLNDNIRFGKAIMDRLTENHFIHETV